MYGARSHLQCVCVCVCVTAQQQYAHRETQRRKHLRASQRHMGSWKERVRQSALETKPSLPASLALCSRWLLTCPAVVPRVTDLQIKPYDAIFAPAPATTRGQATVLSVDEKVGTEGPCVIRSTSTALCAIPMPASSVRQSREQSSKREQTAPAASPLSKPFMTVRLVSFQRLHVRAANAIAVEQGGNLLYGSGRSVVIRNIADPNQAELFTEHAKDVTVAKVCEISPCASVALCRSACAGGCVFVRIRG